MHFYFGWEGARAKQTNWRKKAGQKTTLNWMLQPPELTMRVFWSLFLCLFLLFFCDKRQTKTSRYTTVTATTTTTTNYKSNYIGNRVRVKNVINSNDNNRHVQIRFVGSQSASQTTFDSCDIEFSIVTHPTQIYKWSKAVRTACTMNQSQNDAFKLQQQQKQQQQQGWWANGCKENWREEDLLCIVIAIIWNFV